MTDNLRLWKKAFVTDPAAVKPITGKQYKGNSPKPYWIVEQLTATFGPCGIGWGFFILSERMERLSDTDVLHVAVVRFWYELDGKRGELEQIGQTKVTYWSSPRDGSPKLVVDEDAPKKSVTDALVKCASYLGFAGDIFSGRWDDSKYVGEAGAEWRQRKAANDPVREAWLEEQKAAIAAAKNGKELKSVMAAAVERATKAGDTDALDQLQSAFDAKLASAKPTANQQEAA